MDVLELGKALVNELGTDSRTDVLSRWMAHYIAELMKIAEEVAEEEHVEKLGQCADAILSAWHHRHELPDGKRPFQDMEPVLQALASLDPTNSTPRYFNSHRIPTDESSTNDQSKKWLKLADQLDQTAKLLIRHCLTNASETAADKTQRWVDLAKSAGLDDSIDIRTIRLIIELRGSDGTTETINYMIKDLETTLQQLSLFKKSITSYEAELRRQIAKAKKEQS